MISFEIGKVYYLDGTRPVKYLGKMPWYAFQAQDKGEHLTVQLGDESRIADEPKKVEPPKNNQPSKRKGSDSE